MKWQDKVRLFMKDRPISQRKLAERIGLSDTALSAALQGEGAWNTVQAAIRLAQEMDTTVEYLFSPDTPWPEEPPIHLASPDQRAWAIEALERIARGLPPTDASEESQKGQKPGRQSE